MLAVVGAYARTDQSNCFDNTLETSHSHGGFSNQLRHGPESLSAGSTSTISSTIIVGVYEVTDLASRAWLQNY
jgi:hypothetical protein